MGDAVGLAEGMMIVVDLTDEFSEEKDFRIAKAR